ncbi:MAG: single-stranded DNA-binding protein [Thermoguttaceae bacterium]|nr:single-stranded DNA-binding protein [Thermoguttaceae bacterium]
MASYNRVVLVGNTTRDVELRKIPSGTEVCDLGLAVNERRRDAQGNLIEDVTFVDVTLWGRNASVAAEYTRKGSPVLIEGRLKTDTWETDGQKRSKLKVIADRLVLLSSRNGGGASGAPRQAYGGASQGYQQPQQPSSYQDAPSSFEPNDIADSDLPF